ncbi:MAG TPA: 16S rRNA (guanine(966)-N(2))-methyltransferase RsmD [Acidobacteriota bacterium]|nr:16S rRNA (guanine(966)-N(2))-methyltransferase RsmD [Acidobacteriota bacterium]
MRIIAGRFKKRRLRAVRGLTVRSTADRVKESLFNILAGEIPHAVVLDLFCGAGSLGLEALSRGADRAVFVDRLNVALACTRHNVETLGVERESAVIRMDALTALRALERRGEVFSLIIADPPYGERWPVRTLTAVAESGCRSETGILVIEHHKKDLPGDPPPGFSLWTSRRFGDTVFTIWRWEPRPTTTTAGRANKDKETSDGGEQPGIPPGHLPGNV